MPHHHQSTIPRFCRFSSKENCNVRLPDPFFPPQYKRKKWSGYARLKESRINTHMKKYNNCREYFTHNNGDGKHPYKNNLITLIYSLVNGLYKITTDSMKLVLDVEQFGASSDLIVPIPDVQKVSYLSSFTHPR